MNLPEVAGHPPAVEPPPRGFRTSAKRTLVELAVVLALLGGVVLGARTAATALADRLVPSLPASLDAAIGRSAAESVRAEHAASASAEVTPEDRQRVEQAFGRLRAALTPDETARLIEPRVTVIADATPNAFALPGGEVFVQTGLIARVDDDDELAGVLAHELGHAVARHGVRKLVRQTAFSAALALVAGNLDSLSGALVANAGGLETLRFDRAMESEADAFAVALLRRIGRTPEGLARFLEKLEAQPVPRWLSTHPDAAARAKALREAR